MFKRVSVFALILVVTCMMLVPISADPADALLAQEIQVEVPGEFEIIDEDGNGKAEEVKFTVGINAYQATTLRLTANLEGLVQGVWTPLATSVSSFEWSTDNTRAILVFYPTKLIETEYEGTLRVNLAVAEGDWSLPSQVVGFSSEYSWKQFEVATAVNQEADPSEKILTSAAAKRAAETWAEFNDLDLGRLIKISYDYDQWQVEYEQPDADEGLIRLLVQADGKVRMLKINA